MRVFHKIIEDESSVSETQDLVAKVDKVEDVEEKK